MRTQPTLVGRERELASLQRVLDANGPRIVFVVAPPLIVAVVVWLIRVCFRVTHHDPPRARVILHALLDTSRPEPPAAEVAGGGR